MDSRGASGEDNAMTPGMKYLEKCKGLIEAVGVDDFAHQPQCERCVGIVHLRLEKEAHRPLTSDGCGQSP